MEEEVKVSNGTGAEIVAESEGKTVEKSATVFLLPEFPTPTVGLSILVKTADEILKVMAQHITTCTEYGCPIEEQLNKTFLPLREAARKVVEVNPLLSELLLNVFNTLTVYRGDIKKLNLRFAMANTMAIISETTGEQKNEKP